MTHQFPPGSVHGVQAGIVLAGILISLFGPAAPWIVVYVRWLREQNRKEAAALKRNNRWRNKP